MKEELPSYYFWKAEGDPDPVDAQWVVEYNQIHRLSKLLPHQAPEVAVLKHKDVEQITRSKSETAERRIRRSTPTFKNAWTEAGGGEFYQDRSLRPDFQLRIKKSVGTTIESQWRSQGSLVGIQLSRSDQYAIKKTKPFGPEPGDKKRGEAKATWEQIIEEAGLEMFLKTLLKNNSGKYSALKYGTMLSRFRAVHGKNKSDFQFYDTFNTTIPTSI